MRIRHIILVLSSLFIFIVNASFGQQVYQFSQYQQNLYILNNASAGQNDYLDVTLSYRNQWIGITNSPTTYYVSANMPLGRRLDVKPKQSSTRISRPESYNSIERKSFHAVGVSAAQDSYGPYALNILTASYAFHLPIAEELTLSFSPNVSFNSITFDQNKAIVEDLRDPTYANYVGARNQSSQLDINVAFWLYHSRYFIGYSSDQLIQDRLKLTRGGSLEEIKPNHNFIAGYNFRINRNLILTPNVMLKYVSQTPLSADLNVRLDIQERYWAGLTYRNSHALAGMLGVYFNNSLRLGYSFDFSLNSIQTQNIGSHEIVLGLNFFNKKKAAF